MAIVIEKLKARQILDSRGNPTVEVEILLNNGIGAISSVPSGASKGKTEALELRDNNPKYYFSKSVLKAVSNVNDIIAQELIGKSPFEQNEIDCILKNLDKTDNFSNLGANAVLGVSLAVLEVASKAKGLELFQYVGGLGARKIPIPMVNIINGGAHANNNLDFQEFMIVPLGVKTFSQAVKISAEIFYELKNILSKKGFSTSVCDEGGFCPEIDNEIEALDLIIQAIKKANYTTDTVKLALDIAGSELYKNSSYLFKKGKKILSTSDMIAQCEYLMNKYPIISFEDVLSSEDYNGWKVLTEMFSDRVMLVGDDLFTTNVRLFEDGVKNKIANSILIKPNQIGTISQTLACVSLAKKYGYKTIMSHRSAETENTSIVDLAVGLNCDFVKIGSVSRGERTAKYNRLLRIEEKIKNCNRDF